MDIANVIQAISTVGFPIVMCGIMGYYLKYTHDDHRKDIERIQTQQLEKEKLHKETMERIFDLQQYNEIGDNDNE